MSLLTIYNYTPCSVQYIITGGTTDITVTIPSLNYGVISYGDNTNILTPNFIDAPCNSTINVDTDNNTNISIPNNLSDSKSMVQALYYVDSHTKYAYVGTNGYVNMNDVNLEFYYVVYTTNSGSDPVTYNADASDMIFPTKTTEGVYPLFSQPGQGDPKTTTPPPANKTYIWVIVGVVAIIIIAIIIIIIIVYRKKKAKNNDVDNDTITDNTTIDDTTIDDT